MTTSWVRSTRHAFLIFFLIQRLVKLLYACPHERNSSTRASFVVQTTDGLLIRGSDIIRNSDGREDSTVGREEEERSEITVRRGGNTQAVSSRLVNARQVRPDAGRLAFSAENSRYTRPRINRMSSSYVLSLGPLFPFFLLFPSQTPS